MDQAINQAPETNDVKEQFREFLKKGRKSVLWTGIAYSAVGLLALSFPLASTFATTAMVGILFLMFGGVTFFTSFSFRGTGPFFGAFLSGLLSMAVGIYMFMQPQIAATGLTLMVAFIFMIDGFFRSALAFEIRPEEGWGWILASSIMSILMSIFIVFNLANISNVFLGILIGVNFLSSGIALIMMSIEFKRAMKDKLEA